MKRTVRYGSNRTYPVLLAGLLAAGCSTTPSQYMNETSKVDTTAPFTHVDREIFEQIDLGKLFAVYMPGSGPVAACSDGGPDDKMNCAERAFDQAARNDPNAGKLARNALQERMLAASTQRCNVFKANLQRTFSRTNFGLGALSTLTGTIGALVSGQAAGNWSGASAVFSGIRAEYNQDYMANLAAYVISDGIDQKQREAYREIQTKGQEKGYASYPVQAAIKDALYYHGLCSVMTGFLVAQASIREVANPGLDTSLKTLAKLKIANNIQHGSMTPEEVIEALKKMDTIQPLLAGSSLGKTDVDQLNADSAAKALGDQVAKVGETDKALKDAVANLAKNIKDAKLDDKIKAPEFDPARNFSEKSRLDDLKQPCLGRLNWLLFQEQDSLAKAMDPNSKEPAITFHKEAGKEAHAMAGRIMAYFSSLASGYETAGNDSAAKWQATLEAAIKDNSKIGDFAKAFANPVTLDQGVLGDLTKRCNEK